MSLGASSPSATQIRWAINVEPTWTDGAEQASPSAGAILVTFLVSANKKGNCWGVSISAPEANLFQLGILTGATFTVIKDFTLGAAGQIFVVVPGPLVSNVAAGSSVQVRIVTSATSGQAYQASIYMTQA